jgi:hypothetical protein
MARNRIDLTGQTFGRLTVLQYVGTNKFRSPLWRVECLCGKQKTLSSQTMRSGHSRSCGCLSIESRFGRAARRRHGHTRVGYQSPTYSTWVAMNARCNNPRHHAWKNYGKMGVTVCARWNPKLGGRFENFLADLGTRPDGTSLGRFGDVGIYEPGNCAWQTSAEQGAERIVKNQKRKSLAARAA